MTIGREEQVQKVCSPKSHLTGISLVVSGSDPCVVVKNEDSEVRPHMLKAEVIYICL